MLSTLWSAGCSNHRAGDHHVGAEGVGRQLQSGGAPSCGSQQLGQVEDSHTGRASDRPHALTHLVTCFRPTPKLCSVALLKLKSEIDGCCNTETQPAAS